MRTPVNVTSLTLDADWCLERQNRLRSLLKTINLDSALIADRFYIHALTGYWHTATFLPVALLVGTDSEAVLVAPEGMETRTTRLMQMRYVGQKMATVVENPHEQLARVLGPLLSRNKRVGFAGSVLTGTHPGIEWENISADYQMIRRRKDPDEIRLIRHAILAAEAAYSKARSILQPGIQEIDLYSQMQAAAIRSVGEPVSGWGNDFQSNSMGGLPRQRAAENGELIILDIGVGVRGYRSDLCRTFAVNGRPSEIQKKSFHRIAGCLEDIGQRLKPGVSCKELFELAQNHLHGWAGFRFEHHLGHGIGLDVHEVPRLNPHWNDVLEEGDVLTIEPGLYGPDLRAGIRLEENFLITESGAERLSGFPLEL